MKSPRLHCFFRVRKLVSTFAVITLFGTALFINPATAQAMTFDSGHIDAFNVTADGNSGLLLNLKEDVTGSHVTRAPEDVVIQVSDEAYTERTSNIRGIDRPTWLLPQTQASNLPWPGWDTNGVRDGGFESIDIRFIDVTGPGTIFLYQQDTFGDLRSVTTDGGVWIGSGSVINQAQPAHVHANWGFDAPGTYQITAIASGENANGVNTESNAATYTFEVGSGEIPSGETIGSRNGNTHSGNSDGDTNSVEGAPNAARSGSGAKVSGAVASAGSNSSNSSSRNGSTRTKHSASPNASNAREATSASKKVQRSLDQDATLASDESASSWSRWTWFSLICGMIVLAAGGGFLYYQLRQRRK